MASVVSYTPEWLSRPSAGFDFLASTASAKPSAKPAEYSPNKRLTSFGSQVFYATGNELRWGDLHLLEEDFTSDDGSTSSHGWRTLKVPVSRPIQQISTSPDGQFLAVATSHTCHVCVLPAASHLRSEDTSPLRLKSFQIGPTAHVLEQASIASVLWHPLSVPGQQALITVTQDACVRLWELDINNRTSFDQPGLAIDLKKLANATSLTSDITTSRFGVNRTFSPDDAEMEVAAACFGGHALEDEHGWASMTFWTAMTEGDVYALCPFLPSRFTLSPSTLPSLSTEVIATAQVTAADHDASETEKRKSNDQSIWIADLDGQDTITVADEAEDAAFEVFTRPQRPGAVPKLQGPFQMSSEPASIQITDIHVVAPAINESFLYDSDEEYANLDANQGASVGIVCLATNQGQIHISAILESVSAEWLPYKRSRAITLDDHETTNELLVLHTADLPSGGPTVADAPAFTLSPHQRYEVFVTSQSGVHALDFKPWVYALEDELGGEGASGAEFRLEMLLERAPTSARTILDGSNTAGFAQPTAALALHDAQLGVFVLTTTSSGPHAAILDLPRPQAHPYEPDVLALPASEPRESYQPSPVFFQASDLGRTIAAKNNNPLMKAEYAKPIRVRPESMQLLTDTHRLLSQETHRLGLAAADLFRRCERMLTELVDQVNKVDEISQKATAAINAGDEDGDNESTNGENSQVDAIISGRILQIQSNSDNMEERIKTLRSNILRLGGEDLSIKERAYLEEVQQLQSLIGDSDALAAVHAPTDPGSLVRLPDHDGDSSPASSRHATSARDSSSFGDRLRAAEQLKELLVDATEEIAEKQAAQSTTARKVVTTGGDEYKSQKLAKVLEMLERETALIDAVTERLNRLGGLS